MSTTPTSDRFVGTVIDGRFRLDELLGKGGMGRVYLATQLSVERRVAIKVLREDISESEVVEQRFFREAKTVASIRHSNVVNVIDFGRDEELDALYIVMEYVDGEPLSALLKKGRLPTPLALRVARQICSGLAEAHAAGIVHRDLKPDNVMLETSAEGALTARLLDFGIALPSGEDTRFTATGAVVGTPHYMAPEQAQDQPVDGRADLHAVGVLLFEMLTGRLPWVAETPMAVLLKVVSSPPPPLSECLPPPAMPPDDVVDFLGSLLAKRPDDRPESALAAGRRLDQILDDLQEEEERFPTRDSLLDTVLPPGDEFAMGATLDSPAAGAVSPPEVDASESGAPEASDEPTGPPKRKFALVALAVVVVLGIAAAVALFQFSLPRRPTADPGKAVASTGEDGAPQRSAAKARAVGPEPTSTEATTEPEPPVDPRPVESLREAVPAEEPAEAAVVANAEPDSRGEPPRAGAANGDSPAKPTSPPTSGSREVPVAPPVGKRLLGAKIRMQGGHCPDGEECKYSPDASSAVCPGTSTCEFDCASGNCPQNCAGEATCVFDCSGGDCTQFCQGTSDCTLTCSGGGCYQYCQDQATCRLSCAGGECQPLKDAGATLVEE